MQIKLQIKNWQELTIQDCITIVKLKIPAKLRELYKSQNEEVYITRLNAFTTKDYLQFSKYYGKVLDIMITDYGEFKSVDYIQWHDRLTLYTRYCEDIIRSLFLNTEPVYQYKGIKSFKFGNDEYFLPESLVLFDNEIPGVKEKALTFTEGGAMYDSMLEMQEKGIEKLPYFIAVYCRKKDEAYNEKLVLDRADKFKDLTMDIAWEVFFCIQKLLIVSWKNMMEYSSQAEQQIENMKKAV